jgi:hypothetical protein
MKTDLATKFNLLLEKAAGAVKSKTIWLNAIFLLLLDQLPNLLGQLSVVLPQVQPYIGTELYRNASLFLILGNVFLRFRTKTPLEQK